MQLRRFGLAASFVILTVFCMQSTGAAQRAARQILAESRFHQAGLPHPLHGVLVRIGHVIAAPLNALQSLVATLGTIFRCVFR